MTNCSTDLIERLTQMQASKPVRGTFEVRSTRKMGAITLRVPDLYLHDEPVLVEAGLKESVRSETLLVTVEGDTVRVPSKTFEIRGQEGGEELEVGPLPPGRYRIKVEAKGGFLVAAPVRDVFEVAEKETR
jgi:hypothetical protein